MSLWRRRMDLPLDRDAAASTLPWIIAFMVYLAMLALAAAMTVSSLVGRWDREVAGTLTVQIPPAAPGDRGAEDRLARVVKLLQAQAGIREARPLPAEEIDRLLGRWLGPGAAGGDLPLPRLIDVVIEDGARIDLKALGKALVEIAPGTTIEDHQLWFGDLMVFARSIEVLAVGVMLLVATVGIAIVVYATRAGFAIHRYTVELLHMIGAQDDYIAEQFQRHALALGIRGAVIGVALAGVTLGLLGYLAAQVDTALLPALTLTTLQLVMLGAVPVGAALVVMWTARVAVMRSLVELM